MNLFKEKEIFSDKYVYCKIHGNTEKNRKKDKESREICPYCHSKLISEKEYYMNVINFLNKN